MDKSTQRRLQGAVPPAGCACGCGVFVWWLTDQGRYSSETPWQYYDRNKHVGAVCRDCNRDVPRTHNNSIKAGKGALQPIVGCPKERPCRMPTGHLWSIPNKGHVECLWCHRRKRVEANNGGQSRREAAYSAPLGSPLDSPK